MAAEDRRTKVMDKRGRAGAIEKVLTRSHCSVQFVRHGYYEVCRIEDLEPISEEEFAKRFQVTR